MSQCKHVKDINSAQIRLIRKHLEKHKWYRHLPDDDTAALSFVNEYATLMRDSYCGRECEEWKTCSARDTGKLPDISDGEFVAILKKICNKTPEKLTSAQVYVLHRHVAKHRWIHQFRDYESAAADFINKFGWVVEDICTSD